MNGMFTRECSARTVAPGGASRLIWSAISWASASLLAPTTRNRQRCTTGRPSPRSRAASATVSRWDGSSARASHCATPLARDSAVSASRSRWYSAWRSASVCGTGASASSHASSMGCQRWRANPACRSCWASTSPTICSASLAAASLPVYKKTWEPVPPTAILLPSRRRASLLTACNGNSSFACSAASGPAKEMVTRQSPSSLVIRHLQVEPDTSPGPHARRRI
jgi:hypothetical protein